MRIHICYKLGKGSDHAANRKKKEVGEWSTFTLTSRGSHIGSTFTLELIEVGFGQLLK